VQYQNVNQANATGVEMELGGKFFRELDTTASLAIQQVGLDQAPYQVSNSPQAVGKLRAALPLLKNRLQGATALQYLSSRSALDGLVVPGYWLADLTLTTNRLTPDFDLQFGVRNLFNRAYYDPVSGGLIFDQLLEDGRSVFLKLIWRTKE
jgi:outer membrane receptor protein involved in Fe transport